MNAEEILAGKVLLIDKPLKWSSFQAVNKLKYILKRKYDLPKKFKIGHAGTLDPLATGLLIICTGKFTKQITEIQAQVKADSNQSRGEMVLILHPAKLEKHSDLPESTQQIMKVLAAELPTKQAADLASKITGEGKKALYDLALTWKV